MALDPRIALGIKPLEVPSPLDSAARVMSLRNLLNQGNLQDLQMQEAKRKASDMAQYRSGITPGMSLSDLAAHSARFVGPEKAFDVAQAAENKKTALLQHVLNLELQHKNKLAEIESRAAEGRITRQEADERAKALRLELQSNAERARKEFLGIAAGLRQPREEPAPVSVIGPDGKPVLVRRSEAFGKRPAATDKPITEFQGKAILYGTRAAQSDKILKTLEDKISLPGIEAARSLGRAGNYLMSSEQRRVDQAQRDFVNAILRQESGAVISDAEFANAQRQYFPQPGDDAKTISQKRANREIAIKGFSRMSGPGAADIDVVRNAPLLPGATTGATGGWSIKPLP